MALNGTLYERFRAVRFVQTDRVPRGRSQPNGGSAGDDATIGSLTRFATAIELADLSTSSKVLAGLRCLRRLVAHVKNGAHPNPCRPYDRNVIHRRQAQPYFYGKMLKVRCFVSF
jgi:hypothetical protein